MPRKDSFQEYKQMLLEAHSEDREHFKKIDGEIVSLRIAVEKILEGDKRRAAVFGTIGGVASAIIAGLFSLLK